VQISWHFICGLSKYKTLYQNQIGIGNNSNKEIRKNNKQYIMRAIRAADLARLEHARMHEALRN